MSFTTFTCGSSLGSDGLVTMFIQEAGTETFVLGALLGAVAIALHLLKRDPDLRLALA